MKKWKCCAFIVLVLLNSNALADYGRLVASADDWVFSGRSADRSQFAISSMNWLTQNASNKSILFDEVYYQSISFTPTLINDLQAAGHTVNISHPQDWTPEILSQYGAVVWFWGPEGSGVGSKVLEYAQSGGNVFYVGGDGGQDPPQQFESDILLNAYGISYQASSNGNDVRTLAQFVAHPCVEGVTSLYTNNPSYLGTLTNFNGTVVCAENGNDYIIAVPEPATLLLLGIGGLMLRKCRA